MHSAKGGGFKPCLKETYHNYLFVARHFVHAQGQQAPGKCAKGEPVFWPDFQKNEIVGYKKHRIAHGESRIDDVEFVSVHLKILLHARDVSIGNVEPVNVINPVKQTCE